MSGSLYPAAGDTRNVDNIFTVHNNVLRLSPKCNDVLYYSSSMDLRKFENLLLVIYLSSRIGKCFRSVGCSYVFIIVTLNILQWWMAHAGFNINLRNIQSQLYYLQPRFCLKVIINIYENTTKASFGLSIKRMLRLAL